MDKKSVGIYRSSLGGFKWTCIHGTEKRRPLPAYEALRAEKEAKWSSREFIASVWSHHSFPENKNEIQKSTEHRSGPPDFRFPFRSLSSSMDGKNKQRLKAMPRSLLGIKSYLKCAWWGRAAISCALEQLFLKGNGDRTIGIRHCLWSYVSR